jgi:hypothetical protein
VFGFHDLDLPREVRIYHLAGTQHVPAGTPAAGICQQLSNANPYQHSMRALLVALRAWVVSNTEPPASRYPTLRRRTLVDSSKRSVGFPTIPGVRYTGLIDELDLVDYGRHFDADRISGIIDEPLRVCHRLDYRVLVPRVDHDGNEVDGLRSVGLEAPLGTYTGWNLRRAGFAENELCGLTGSFIPFAETRAERLAKGDPRPSLEERYGDHDGYVMAVREAAEDLVAARLLLPADASLLIAQAQLGGVL